MTIKTKLIGTAIATTLFCASGASFAAMAPDYHSYHQQQMDYSGFYLSGQFGYSTSEVNGVISGLDGIAGRLSFGYDFNQYFGLEFGAARYNDIDSLVEDDFDYEKATIKTGAIDLLAKGMLPISHSNMNVFLKAGVAEVFRRVNDINSVNSRTRPEVALGFGYRVTPNVGFNFTLARIFSTTNSIIDNDIDSFFAGLTYHFV